MAGRKRDGGKVTRVECTMGRVYNLGNYRSLRVEYRVERVVGVGETARDAAEDAERECDLLLGRFAASRGLDHLGPEDEDWGEGDPGDVDGD